MKPPNPAQDLDLLMTMQEPTGDALKSFGQAPAIVEILESKVEKKSRSVGVVLHLSIKNVKNLR